MTRLKVHITTLPFNKDNLAFLEQSFDVTINPLEEKLRMKKYMNKFTKQIMLLLELKNMIKNY